MTRPRGAMASALRRIPGFPAPRTARPSPATPGSSSIPAYARLVNSEPYVKRLIPILIVLFVVALGAMRAVALYQAHAEVADQRRASALADRQGGGERARRNRAEPLSLTEPSETLQGQLENALPPLGHRPRPADSASWTRRAWSSPRARASRTGRPLHRRDPRAEPAADDARREGRRAAAHARLRRGGDRHRPSQSRRRRRDRRAAADCPALSPNGGAQSRARRPSSSRRASCSSSSASPITRRRRARTRRTSSIRRRRPASTRRSAAAAPACGNGTSRAARSSGRSRCSRSSGSSRRTACSRSARSRSSPTPRTPISSSLPTA